MRCLRCGIDYEAAKRFCDKCGRALSRPPGLQDNDADGLTALLDTTHLYTTFSPPNSATAGQAVPTTSLPPLPVPIRPATGRLDVQQQASPPLPLPSGQHRPTPSGHWPVPASIADMDEEDEAEERSRRGGLPVPPRSRPTSIGVDITSWRATHARRRTSKHRRLLLLAAAALCGLLVLVGGLAILRHNAYSRDLARARSLADAHQFGLAFGSFHAAIDDWPSNGEAQNGMLATQATATMVALHLQQGAATLDLRQSIYQARLQQRVQVAQQVDVAAQATATAAAQATATAQVQATMLAQTHATATAAAQATAVAVAQRTAAAAVAATATAQAVAAQSTATAVAGQPLAIQVPNLATQPIVYAAIGGVGLGATNQQPDNWPLLLAGKLSSGSQLLRFGSGDALLAADLQQLPTVIASHPDLVTLWLGASDLAAQVPPQGFRANLAALLGGLRHATHAAIFVNTFPDLTQLPHYRGLDQGALTARIAAYNAIISQVAAANQTVVVDLYSATKTMMPAHPAYASADGAHFSSDGYAALVEVWWGTIRTHVPGGH